MLILTAAIWGFAFVAQRLGMQSLDPFSFNAVRFALGAVFVWIIAARKHKAVKQFPVLLGFVLFIAASFQQIGLLFTGAGSAGFITGLYVVMVPLLGLFRAQKLKLQTGLAVLLALVGLFFLNRPGNLEASFGNLLVFISAVFWAWHVQLVDFYAKKLPVAYLAFSQFAFCALLSGLGFVVYFALKAPAYLVSVQLAENLLKAIMPILYGGLLSVGIAYSLQIKGQQKAEPGKAAVIMCSEGVFAMFGGWLILGETVDMRIIIGVAFMLSGMLLSIIPNLFD